VAKSLPRPTGTLVLDYVPRAQFIPFHERRERYSATITHRRCGKTVAAVNDLIMRAIAHSASKPPGRYAYVGPTYMLAKDTAWEFLKQYSHPFLCETPNESELRVDLWNGSRVRLYGGDNPDSLRGLAFDEIVLDEYADMSPSLFPAVVRPALADRRGRAVFIGTVKGRNHLWQTYLAALNDPDWFTALLPASVTGLIPDDELAAARKDMGNDRYEAEFECNPETPIVGAYYGPLLRDAEREGRVAPDLKFIDGPIHTAWDLGHGSNMAIWAFQIGLNGILVHDFISVSDAFFLDYIAEVKKRGYTGKCYVPHDIAARSFESGRTRIETLASSGLNPVPVPLHSVEDRINAAQLTLPRTTFNSIKCELGLAGLREYRRDWDEKLKVFKDTPKHDWASHPADAFGYLAIAWRGVAQIEDPPPKPLFKSIDELSMDEWILSSDDGIVEKRMRV